MSGQGDYLGRLLARSLDAPATRPPGVEAPDLGGGSPSSRPQPPFSRPAAIRPRPVARFELPDPGAAFAGASPGAGGPEDGAESADAGTRQSSGHARTERGGPPGLEPMAPMMPDAESPRAGDHRGATGQRFGRSDGRDPSGLGAIVRRVLQEAPRKALARRGPEPSWTGAAEIESPRREDRSGGSRYEFAPPQEAPAPAPLSPAGRTRPEAPWVSRRAPGAIRPVRPRGVEGVRGSEGGEDSLRRGRRKAPARSSAVAGEGADGSPTRSRSPAQAMGAVPRHEGASRSSLIVARPPEPRVDGNGSAPVAGGPPPIQVTIGRVDVRAVPPPEVRSGTLSVRRSAPRPVMSLEEYLKGRAGGGTP